MWYKIRHDKGVRIIILIVLLCILVTAISFYIEKYTLPKDAEQIEFAKAYKSKSSWPTSLQWFHKFDETDIQRYQDIWNKMDWQVEPFRKTNPFVSTHVIYELRLIYASPNDVAMRHAWLYFWDNGKIRIDYMNGTSYEYTEQSGNYPELLEFFNELEYETEN